MSRLQAAVETTVHDAEAAFSPPAQPGVVRSLTFWLCLLLAAGGYALATLAPTWLRNQQLRAESAAADAELRRLVAQVDRYERYCSRLTAANDGNAPVDRDGSDLVAPSPRPSPPQWANTSRGEGEISVARNESAAPLQQIVVEESLQFQLEDVAVTGGQVSAPSVTPVIALFGRSRLARVAIRTLSAALLLLAFTLCLDPPRERTVAVVPRHSARRMRHPLAWLGLRYRSADSVGHN